MGRTKYVTIIVIGLGCIITVLLFSFGILSLNLSLNLSTAEYALIIGAIGVIIAVIALLYQRRIAQQTVFKKATLKVSVMGQRLIPKPEFSEIFFGYSIGKGDAVFCEIPFVIENTGDLSAKNIQIRLSFPLSLRCGEGLMDNIKIGPGVGFYDKSRFKRRAYKYRGFEYVDYLLSEMAPHQKCPISEPVDVTYSSSIPVEVNAVSKDGVPLKVGVDFLVSSKIEVGICAEDIAPFTEHFFVGSVEAEDMKELQKKVAAKRMNILKKMDWRRAAENDLPNPFKDAIAVMPNLKKVPKPKEGPQIKGTVYVEERLEQSRIEVLHVSKKIDPSRLAWFVVSSPFRLISGARHLFKKKKRAGS